MPAVSIVTATYNRSNVLRLTIESVRASTFADWELIVVGDACTDDTSEVVASFGDERIRFVNLERNFGEQSAPNNAGARLARGRYLAFLNHDDLWLPEHLEVCIAELERGDADLVFPLELFFDSENLPSVTGATNGEYQPYAGVPASLWVMRRTLFDEVGPLRAARALHIAPTQEWIFRAWRMKKRLRGIPRITCVAVQSGRRTDSYADREFAFNAEIARRVREDDRFLVDMLTEVARAQAVALSDFRVGAPLIRAAKNIVRRIALACGIHPTLLGFFLRYRRRGAFIDDLRKSRGLPPLPRVEELR